jgi:hypothetical protein
VSVKVVAVSDWVVDGKVALDIVVVPQVHGHSSPAAARLQSTNGQ